MKTVLTTKKLTEKVKIKLENAEFLIVEKNFIKVKKLKFELDLVYENLIFTSKNAVKCVLPFQKELMNKPVFCVGEKTKKLLEKKGFTVKISAKNATELAEKIVSEFVSHSFTFFCGNIRKDSLPTILKTNNVVLNEIVVYKTTLNPKKITSKTNAILFFSPSAVESYLLKNKIENQICFCIGNTTAKTLNSITNQVEIAKKPTVEAVIKKCIKYYKK